LVESRRDEPTRSTEVRVYHPPRVVARPAAPVSDIFGSGCEKISFDVSTATVPGFARAFRIDDLLSLHALGAYSDQMLSETLKVVGMRCFEELQKPTAPRVTTPAPTAPKAPVAGFGKDTRRVLV
jgi:hypothetical protein